MHSTHGYLVCWYSSGSPSLDFSVFLDLVGVPAVAVASHASSRFGNLDHGIFLSRACAATHAALLFNLIVVSLISLVDLALPYLFIGSLLEAC